MDGFLDRHPVFRIVCQHMILIAIGIGILDLLYETAFKQIRIRSNRRVTSALITDVTSEVQESERDSVSYLGFRYEFYVGTRKYVGWTSGAMDSPLQVGDRLTISYSASDPVINAPGVLGTGPELFFYWILFLGVILGFLYYLRWYLKWAFSGQDISVAINRSKLFNS
jgi:hypothetical protein